MPPTTGSVKPVNRTKEPKPMRMDALLEEYLLRTPEKSGSFLRRGGAAAGRRRGRCRAANYKWPSSQAHQKPAGGGTPLQGRHTGGGGAHEIVPSGDV